MNHSRALEIVESMSSSQRKAMFAKKGKFSPTAFPKFGGAALFGHEEGLKKNSSLRSKAMEKAGKGASNMYKLQSDLSTRHSEVRNKVANDLRKMRKGSKDGDTDQGYISQMNAMQKAIMSGKGYKKTPEMPKAPTGPAKAPTGPAKGLSPEFQSVLDKKIKASIRRNREKKMKK